MAVNNVNSNLPLLDDANFFQIGHSGLTALWMRRVYLRLLTFKCEDTTLQKCFVKFDILIRLWEQLVPGWMKMKRYLCH